MKIIAFGHRQGVGKSTFTRFLIGELRMHNKGIHIVQAAFSDKVKDVAYQLFGWAGLQPGHYYETDYLLKNQILPEIGLTPRQLWIGVGNGVRQATGFDDTWGQYLLHYTKADLLVINDLRFPAEADLIKRHGGTVYRIDRQSSVQVTDGADDRLANYESWTGYIDNNGTLNDLHKRAVQLAETL